MYLRNDIDVEAITGAISANYQRPVSLVPVRDPAFKGPIGDATLKFRARLPDGSSGFLLVSGPGNPRLVSRAVRNIHTARACLSAETAAPILLPVLTGEIEGHDFALWPELCPFHATSRLKNFVLRHRYTGPILGWSERLTVETLQPGDPERFLADLQVIAGDDAFPPEMRADAAAAADRIASGAWRPKNCLHHGDFWTGNILLPKHPRTPGFSVIDWAGMQRAGYPFLDLSRMVRSLRVTAAVRLRHVETLRRVVGCERRDVPAYLLSAFGHIGRNLEHFPVDRFWAMAIQVYRSMKTDASPEG